MPADRPAVTALVALVVVDVFHTIAAIALYQHRIGVVTHDGSAIVEMLDTIVPLRELSSVTAWLLFLTLLTTVAAVVFWLAQSRRTGKPFAPTAPVSQWRISAIVALPVNLLAAVQYLFTTERGGEYMRTAWGESGLLLVAASVALVVTAVLGIQVVRRTEAHTTGAGATSA
jgi:hypothetical protein